MSGYVIARENFKEAERQVSAERDPVMFNLLYGLQSLTDQLESDFTRLHAAIATRAAGRPKAKAAAKKAANKPSKKAAKKPGRR